MRSEPTFWNDVLLHIRRSHPELVRSWFVDLASAGIESGVLRVLARNEAQVRYLTSRCRQSFAEAAQRVTGCLVTVAFEAVEPPEAEPPAETVTFGDPLNWELRLDNFVEGPCNRLAFAAANATAGAPGHLYDPLFLYGGRGVGKTHLLHAICHAAHEQRGGARCIYVSSDRFTHELVTALEQDRWPDVRQELLDSDVLAVDDVHRLTGRERSQEELFGIFNALQQSGGQLVLSCDRPPSELQVEPRLISRFASGLVASLEPPCLETRLGIVRSKAERMGIALSDSIYRDIAESLDQGMQDLENRLLHAEAQGDVPGNGRSSPTTVTGAPSGFPGLASLAHEIAQRFHLTDEELRGPQRSRHINRPRQLGMYLARRWSDASFEAIGAFFGGRNQSTVRHATLMVAKRLESDARLRQLVAELQEEFQSA